MLEVKRYLNKILSNKYIPIIVLTMYFICRHYPLQLFADDIWFSKIIDNQSLLSYISTRYSTWTSRLLIESCLVSILSIGFWLWKILDITIIDILYISLSKLFNKEKKPYINWLIVILIMLYNFRDMSTAGWAATSLNYLWPLALGLFSLICFKKLYYGEHIKAYEYIFYFLSLIYAINEEQMCIILVAVSVIFTIYFIYKKDKKALIPLLFSILCIGSLIFIFTTPGNALRKIQETKTWYLGYNMLTFTDKIIISITSTISEYLFSLNLIYILLILVLFMAIFIKYKKISAIVIPTIPILVYSLSTILPCINGKKINVLNLYDFVPVTNMNFDKVESYIPFIVCVLVILSLILSIYMIFENTKTSFLFMFILIIGILSRMAIVFSPTMYVSDRRTFIFLTFSMVIVIIMVIKKVYNVCILNKTSQV